MGQAAAHAPAQLRPAYHPGTLGQSFAANCSARCWCGCSMCWKSNWGSMMSWLPNTRYQPDLGTRAITVQLGTTEFAISAAPHPQVATPVTPLPSRTRWFTPSGARRCPATWPRSTAFGVALSLALVGAVPRLLAGSQAVNSRQGLVFSSPASSLRKSARARSGPRSGAFSRSWRSR